MQARIGTGIGLVQPLAQALAQTLRRGAAVLARSWRRLVGEPYRPEKHYMRGPGPKWRAKYASGEARAATRLPQRGSRPKQDATAAGR
jgi:hypothetical protein